MRQALTRPVKMSIYLSRTVDRKLASMAKRQHTSKAELVRIALDAYLGQAGPTPQRKGG